MKIFGRFHLNNISRSPPTTTVQDRCIRSSAPPDCRPPTTTFRARTHTPSHGYYCVRTLLKPSRVRATEVYKHTNEIRSYFFFLFPLFFSSFFFTSPRPFRLRRATRRVYNVCIADARHRRAFIEFRRFPLRRFLNDFFFLRGLLKCCRAQEKKKTDRKQIPFSPLRRCFCIPSCDVRI
jgi:hypothetical protein